MVSQVRESTSRPSGVIGWEDPGLMQMIVQARNTGSNVQKFRKLTNVGKIRRPFHGSVIGRNFQLERPIFPERGVLTHKTYNVATIVRFV